MTKTNEYKTKDLLQFARRIALGTTPTKAAIQVWPDLSMLSTKELNRELKFLCNNITVKKEVAELKNLSADDVRRCLINSINDKVDGLHILRTMMNDESLAPSQRISAIKLMAEIEGFAGVQKTETTIKMTDEQISEKIKDIFCIGKE